MYRLITQFFDQEIAQKTRQPEYEAAYQMFAREVILLMLEQRQSDGHTLKPCFIYGDLWKENTGLNLETEGPVLFDASVFMRKTKWSWAYGDPTVMLSEDHICLQYLA